MEAKQAENSNWYINVEAQPVNDEWADAMKYRMWVGEGLKDKLMAKQPTTIELRRVTVEVEPFQRINDDGEISEKVCTTLSVVARCHKDELVDDPQKMANKLRKQLLDDDKICDVEEDDDPMAGSEGMPE